MKKIVMGIAAVAMAASVFAADLTAKVDIDGNLFNFTADSLMQDGQKITKTSGNALALSNHSQPWNENLKVAFTDGEGKSGGEFKLSTKGAFDAALMATSYKVWFTPMEGLKFNFGETDIALNKEQIDWATETGVGGKNYSVSYSNSGFSVDLALATDWIKINAKDVWTKTRASESDIAKAALEAKKANATAALSKADRSGLQDKADDALAQVKSDFALAYDFATNGYENYEKDLNAKIKTERDTDSSPLAVAEAALKSKKNEIEGYKVEGLTAAELNAQRAETTLAYNKEKADFDKKAADFKPLTLGGTYLKVAYAADFGTIGAFMNATDTFKNIKFGLGYSHNISGIDFFVNLYGNVAEMWNVSTDTKSSDFKVVGAEIFAKGSVDAISWKVYAKPSLNIETMKAVNTIKDTDPTNANGVGFLDFFGYKVKATAEYAMGSCTPYAELTVEDGVATLVEKEDGTAVDREKLTDSNIAVTLKPGVKGKVGALDWNVGLEAKVSADARAKMEKVPGTVDFSIGIPVCFAIAF